MGTSKILTINEENLKKVTSISIKQECNTLALIINYLPDEGGPKKYDVIDTKPEKPGDLPDIGKSDIKLAGLMLEVLSGQTFIEIEEDTDWPFNFFVRKNFKKGLILSIFNHPNDVF